MRFLFLIPLCAVAGAVFGQGSLTPPGAPGPTMKTLDQVEARTPIPGGTAPYTISASGSYYLTGNITVATGDVITSTAANVTIDLNGFNLATTSATPSGAAVRISGRRTTVYNGTVSGTGTVSGDTFNGGGFVNGVIWTGAIPQAISVRDVLVTGCSTTGIKASLVERCVLQNIGQTGISGAIVRACQVDFCGGAGIYGSAIADCVVSAYGTGIVGGNAVNCSAFVNTGSGLACGSAQNCSGATSGDSTTAAIAATTATNCVGTSYGRAFGVKAETAVGSKGTSDSGTGMEVTTAATSSGVSTSFYGLSAVTATGCQGTSSSGFGLQTLTGENCIGRTTSGAYGINSQVLNGSYGSCSSGGGTGLFAYSALSCQGFADSGTAVFCTAAANCSATSLSASLPGLRASTATGCNASNFGAGPAISTTIAIGCTASGPISATYRYNQP